MPAQNDALRERLSRFREITISVTGRKTGRTISNPVWFALDEDNLYLLPVQGSDTQWYKNVLKNPSIRIDARGAEAEVKVVLITDATQVSSVVEKFRHKYGASDVRKYYSKFDVTVVADAVMASFQLPVHRPLPLFPNIGKPEVIGSCVGLVRRNRISGFSSFRLP